MITKFKSGSSVYTCDCCGKKTRDTGRGEYEGFGHGVCFKCYDEAGWENEHMDYGEDHNGAGRSPDNCPMCR